MAISTWFNETLFLIESCSRFTIFLTILRGAKRTENAPNLFFSPGITTTLPRRKPGSQPGRQPLHSWLPT